MGSDSPPIDRQSPAQAKIRLFRSLFRGREDIYARRFESRRTGKHGYAQACANEWVRGVCEKPRVKCASASIRSCTQRDRGLPVPAPGTPGRDDGAVPPQRAAADRDINLAA
jgi:hypothetical protein